MCSWHHPTNCRFASSPKYSTSPNSTSRPVARRPRPHPTSTRRLVLVYPSLAGNLVASTTADCRKKASDRKASPHILPRRSRGGSRYPRKSTNFSSRIPRIFRARTARNFNLLRANCISRRSRWTGASAIALRSLTRPSTSAGNIQCLECCRACVRICRHPQPQLPASHVHRRRIIPYSIGRRSRVKRSTVLEAG